MSKKVARNRIKSKRINQNKPPDLDADVNEIFTYGKALLKGENNTSNKKEAIKYIKLAADKDHIEASLIYARMLQNGDGIQCNKDTAQEYYKKAINGQNVDAMLEYGKICEDRGDTDSLCEALLIYKKASEFGNVESMYRAAEIEFNGIDNIANHETAAKYYKMAADGGYLPAIPKYSILLSSGIGVEKDTEKAK